MPGFPALQLHTTVLRVSDLERSRTFYETTLEMQVVYEDLRYKLISLEMGGGSRVTLWELRPEDKPLQTGTDSVYMVFFSNDVAGYREELLRRGVNVEPLFLRDVGLRLFWFTDPDGHRFCVIQFTWE